VRKMRVRLDPNEAAESTSRLVSERVFVKKIARGARTGVILQRAGVEFLSAITTQTARRSLRAPSPVSLLKLSKREYAPPRWTFKLKPDASRATVVALIWIESTLSSQVCAQM